MRTLFIDQNELDDLWGKEEINGEPITEEIRRRFAPWAAEIHAVEGGWRAWESVSDYSTWLNQQ
jgi:hypothetical protein